MWWPFLFSFTLSFCDVICFRFVSPRTLKMTQFEISAWVILAKILWIECVVPVSVVCYSFFMLAALCSVELFSSNSIPLLVRSPCVSGCHVKWLIPNNGQPVANFQVKNCWIFLSFVNLFLSFCCYFFSKEKDEKKMEKAQEINWSRYRNLKRIHRNWVRPRRKRTSNRKSSKRKRQKWWKTPGTETSERRKRRRKYNRRNWRQRNLWIVFE